MIVSTSRKIAVFAPIPSVSVRSATVVNPGFRAKDRRQYRMSRIRVSNQATSHASRECSVISAVFPILRLAFSMAVSRL